jgi:predicted nucleic acid-binding Zn ribbon protein
MPAEKDPGPERLSDVLGHLFAARGWGHHQQQLRLEEAWRQAAGEPVAKLTRAGNLKRGVLEVQVQTGVLLQELAHFHKRRLLEALQQRLGPQVKDLRFKLAAK